MDAEIKDLQRVNVRLTDFIAMAKQDFEVVQNIINRHVSRMPSPRPSLTHSKESHFSKDNDIDERIDVVSALLYGDTEEISKALCREE